MVVEGCTVVAVADVETVWVLYDGDDDVAEGVMCVYVSVCMCWCVNVCTCWCVSVHVLVCACVGVCMCWCVSVVCAC